MTLAFSPNRFPDSLVSRLDARWRLVSLATLFVAVACLRSLAVASLALFLALILARSARVAGRWFVLRFGGLLIAVAPLVLLLPVSISEAGVGWSTAAVPPALALAARALALGSLALIVIGSAPLPTTLHAAHAVGVPGVLVHVLLLSWRYTFLLAEEWHRLRIALRTRGFRGRSDVHTWRTVGIVAGNLLVRGVERAERVGQAMRCRGFAGRFHSLAEFRTHAVDVVALLVAGLVGVGLVTLDRLILAGMS